MYFCSSGQFLPLFYTVIQNCFNVIVKSHYEKVIIVITWVRGGAEDECNNNYNLRVQWDLTGFYPIIFDVCNIMQKVITAW